MLDHLLYTVPCVDRGSCSCKPSTHVLRSLTAAYSTATTKNLPIMVAFLLLLLLLPCSVPATAGCVDGGRLHQGELA
jgi:hypothetical protein